MLRRAALLSLTASAMLATGCAGGSQPSGTASTAPSSPAATGAAPASPGAAPSPGQASPAAQAGYNVVLVSFDALRAHETSLFGYERDTTPNLKKFAEQAVVLDDAIAAGSWTLPSTMAIFTGLYPSVHGVVNKLMPDLKGELKDTTLTPSVKTLPQYLHEAGYILGGFTGDAGVSARFGFGRDFDKFVDDLKFGGLDHSQPAAIEWVKAHKDKKFFLFLHGYDCHGQYDPPEGYKRTFAKDYKGKLKGDKDEQAGFREKALRNKFDGVKPPEPYLKETEFSKDDGRFYQALYDEKIQRADGKFAEFLKFMEEQKLMDKTIFVVVADHGEEFLEHGNIDHGPTLYQEMVHVPVVIKIPGMAPRHIKERVGSFDALPTVLDYLGIKTGKLDAVSLLPLLQGKSMDLPPVYSETDYRLFSHKRAYFQGDNKLIKSLDTGRVELYDLKKDPLEKHPMAAKGNKTAQEMATTLETWINSLPRRYESYETDVKDIIKIF